MKIGIIGGGPAGILAALEASKIYDHVTIIDKNDFLGRKLSTTGGGRGNLTNQYVSPGSYAAFHDFVFDDLINQFDYRMLIEYFKNLGIYTYHTDDGWTYPLSNSAKNVSNILESTVIQNNIFVQRNSTVENIDVSNGEFVVFLDNGKKLVFNKLIIASGGKAQPQLNASDAILDVVKRLGHRIIPAHPALSPLETTKQDSKLLNGVRINAETSILSKGKCIAKTFGNIIFTDWGVNGPGVMDLSHQYFRHQGEKLLKINFSSSENISIIRELLTKFNQSSYRLTHILLNLFPMKIVNQLLVNARLKSDITLNQLNFDDISEFMENLSIEEQIIGTRGFEFAQISTGAVSSKDIDSTSLESKIIRNLYFAGEILDVIGPCGGYNLHWAFVSGINAGRSLREK